MRWLVNAWSCADILFIDGLVVEKSWAGNPTPTILDEIRGWLHLDCTFRKNLSCPLP
jgi:hypothetical protein